MSWGLRVHLPAAACRRQECLHFTWLACGQCITHICSVDSDIHVLLVQEHPKLGVYVKGLYHMPCATKDEVMRNSASVRHELCKDGLKHEGDMAAHLIACWH